MTNSRCVFICLKANFFTCLWNLSPCFIPVFLLGSNFLKKSHLLISVQFIRSVGSDSVTPWTAARLPCPSPSPRSCSNSVPLSQWCHPTISSSVIPFSSCPQYFPESGSSLMNQLTIGASASASVLLINIQDWFPLGLTGLISLQSKGFSRVFSNTTFQKHQFFCAQPSLWSSSHIHMCPLEKP